VTTLVYLVLCYHLSISPDDSFAASWVLAATPLAFVGATVIEDDRTSRRWLLGAPLAITLLLAMSSALRFVLFGERAQAPLVDPNNYAALMYLAWIPLVHRDLTRGWSGRARSVRLQFGVFAASFVLVLAIVATRSRTALVLVAGCLALWFAIALAHRARTNKVWAHVAVASAAWCVGLVVNHLTDATLKGLQFEGGLAVRAALVRSAWAIWTEHPLGIGIFCFPLLYHSVRATSEQDTAGLFVHNDYVQFLVEGGVPLLLLLIAFVVVVTRRSLDLARLGIADRRFADLGFGIAIAAASAHAFVNFVYYSLPLDILVGIFAARLFGVRATGSTQPQLPTGGVRLTAIGLGVGWLMWAYLALDVVTAGVFQGQPSLGLTSSIGSDPQRMLAFARVAQTLNGNRGIPALAEGMLLHRLAEAEPNSRYLPEAANRAFQRALAVDPWNTMAYVRYAQFLRRFPGANPGQSSDELLLSAVAFDPTFSPAIDELVEGYERAGTPSKAYGLLRNVVYPWMRTLRRNDPQACERYLVALQAYARATHDAVFLAELDARRVELSAITPRGAAPQVGAGVGK
jgi:O-antigen ligase